MDHKQNLPEWICHKRVRAAKIVNIQWEPVLRACPVLHLEGGGYVNVNPSYMDKHKPECGGYYVRYADGYESFSPSKAFEEGYTLAGQGVDIDAIHRK